MPLPCIVFPRVARFSRTGPVEGLEVLQAGSVQKDDGEVETLGTRQQGSLHSGEEDIEAPEA